MRPTAEGSRSQVSSEWRVALREEEKWKDMKSGERSKRWQEDGKDMRSMVKCREGCVMERKT